MDRLKNSVPALPALWSADLVTRLTMLEGHGAKAAWLYGSRDDSTFRYRVLNPVEGMIHHGAAAASWFFLDEADAILSRLNELDSLILCRLRYDPAVAHIITAARAAGVRVIFDCDDLVFDVNHVVTVMQAVAVDMSDSMTCDYWFSYIARLQATAKLCDAGIATTDSLAERMSEIMKGKPVSILANHLNRAQQEYSKTLLDKRLSDQGDTDAISIGYFSGSPSHLLDFEVALPAIIRLMDRYRAVTARLVGYVQGYDELISRFGSRVEILPYTNWLELQKLISEVDINVAPLQLNDVTECKSNLKFFEAAAVGTWSVVSSTEPFQSSIVDGVSGQIAWAHDWDTQLEKALATVSDRSADRRRTLSKIAFMEYGWDCFGDRTMAAVLA